MSDRLTTRKTPEIVQIVVDAEQARRNADLAGLELKWYEKLAWMAVGGVLFQGLPELIDSVAIVFAP